MRTPAKQDWKGVSAAERREQRRTRLLDAAAELLGTEGVTAVTVRATCRTAKLTERYFYEEFEGRDALLTATYDRSAVRVIAALREAIPAGISGLRARARAGVSGLLDYFAHHPADARILVIEAVREPVLTRRGTEATILLMSLVTDEKADPVDEILTGTVLGAGLGVLFAAWLDGQLPVDRERFVEHATRLIEHTVRVSSHSEDQTTEG
ncbi:TetR family transcriptional regulator [Amycolatopsis cynarae]|uniref:TetR family transcriptional regulator n=1 Tax=Amycolatopsis cynarae TaxID=2995223 RepID=A0ABY7BBB6_9PSEU|nr:TetR family transcriptional regulator [Amycolatopsis sp. HUAS 11-8]WAL69239.1 TetR family transcriptional regulator [Amycolatopsis sp. HUAS 11-8]